MVSRTIQDDKASSHVKFASPPWNRWHPAWQGIDQRLDDNHLARRIAEGVDRLDLEPLLTSYQGRGSAPLPPGLMLKIVMYEMATGHPSPAQWFRDTRECDPVKWLGFGIQPSRTACYEFWDRVLPYWDAWNEQVLRSAIDQGFTNACRAAQDGTTVAAHASRHKMVNQETLQRRTAQLNEAITADQQGHSPNRVPGWMAKRPETREEQRTRYQRATQRLEQLHTENQKRTRSKRRAPEKVFVSTSDLEAAYGRDKLNVFRPLYNVQLHYDLDSPFILGYDVFAQPNDAGTLPPTLERTSGLTGVKPEVLLADSTYATIGDLEVCQQHGITLYAPVSESHYSQQNERRPQTNQFTQLPKSKFTWVADQKGYLCPEGHLLEWEATTWGQRSNGRLRVTRYRCSPEHCGLCRHRVACTPTPDKGRSVSRLDNEELLEELRQRMQTDQAKTLYRLRSQTVELAFADLKEHRSLRRLSGRGLRKAKAQVAALVLVHNLLTLSQKERHHESCQTISRTLQKIA